MLIITIILHACDDDNKRQQRQQQRQQQRVKIENQRVFHSSVKLADLNRLRILFWVVSSLQYVHCPLLYVCVDVDCVLNLIARHVCVGVGVSVPESLALSLFM